MYIMNGRDTGESEEIMTSLLRLSAVKNCFEWNNVETLLQTLSFIILQRFLLDFRIKSQSFSLSSTKKYSVSSLATLHNSEVGGTCVPWSFLCPTALMLCCTHSSKVNHNVFSSFKLLYRHPLASQEPSRFFFNFLFLLKDLALVWRYLCIFCLPQ